MPTPSVFQQGLTAHSVPAWSLVPSPRNYNASIVEHKGRRLMAYRSHRMDQGGRCGIVVCQMNAKWEAVGNTWLDLPEQVFSVTLHHEDPRLFVFRGRLYVAYTETTFRNQAPYVCTMKYALLKERNGKGWAVERVYWPRYGQNDGAKQEKNWQFFEWEKKLCVVYQGEPHTVLELDGEQVTGVHKAPAGTKWPWGAIRGGTPPILAGEEYLTFFHSATPYPVAPHWRRYYAAAYRFEAKPPFRITGISQLPLLTGSEEDGHGYDPRQIDSWKPFVVFPSGIIENRTGKWGAVESWSVSYGINDHTIAIVEHRDLKLGDPTFATWGWRYFFTENGSAPVRVWVDEDKPPRFIRWERARGGMAGQCNGVIATTDPRLALQLGDTAGVSEIKEGEYKALRC